MYDDKSCWMKLLCPILSFNFKTAPSWFQHRKICKLYDFCFPIMLQQPWKVIKYKLHNQTSPATSSVNLNTPHTSNTCPSFVAAWLFSQQPELLMWCKLNAGGVLILGFGYHHGGWFTMQTHRRHCGAATDKQAEKLAMEAEVRTGVMAWRRVCGGDVVHLPRTAYRLSSKLVGSYGSDSWRNGLTQAQLYVCNCECCQSDYP